MPGPSRRKQAREAVKKGKEKAEEGAERIREGKEKAEQTLQRGRQRVRQAKAGAEQAQERWSGERTEQIKEDFKSAVSGGSSGPQRPGDGKMAQGRRPARDGQQNGQQPPQRGRRPQGELPHDGGAPPDSTPTIEQFERTMVGGMGAADDPMRRRGEFDRMPSPGEFEDEFLGAEPGGMEAFERDFLRRL